MKQRLHKLYRNRRFRIMAPIFLGCVVLVILLMLFLPKSASQSHAVSEYNQLPKANPQHQDMKNMQMHEELSLSAEFTQNALQVTNGESGDLKKCNLALNAGMVQKGYTVQKTLPVNKPLTVQYNEFMRYGVRFNPAKSKVVSLTVMCNDEKQTGWKYFSNK